MGQRGFSYKHAAARDRALRALLRMLLRPCPHGTRGRAFRELAYITGLSVSTLYKIAELDGTPRPRG